MDLNEISIFVRVVQDGSFSKAAKTLGIPNSTVSSKVSSLEKRLGVTLIQRTTRKLSITQAGQVYFKGCLEGMGAIQTAEAEIASSQTEPQGLLRITAPVELGNKVLPEALSRFSAKFQKVRVEVLLTDREVDLVGEGFDLAIRTGKLNDSSLIAKRIGIVNYALYASPNYLKAKPRLSHPRDLSQHQCLAFTSIGAEHWRLVGPAGVFEVPLAARIKVNNLSMLKEFVLRGDGIAYFPSFLVRGELASKKLTRVLPAWRSDLNPVQFVYPGHRFVAPQLRAFMSDATEVLRGFFE